MGEWLRQTKKTGGFCPTVCGLVDIFENLDVGWEVSVCFNVQTTNVSPLKALQTSMLNGENNESHTIFLGVFCWVFSLYIVMLVAKTRKHIRRAYWTKSTWTLFRLVLYCLFTLFSNASAVPTPYPMILKSFTASCWISTGKFLPCLTHKHQRSQWLPRYL